MNKRITFVTHGSKQLGMGHVMRCCSLADAFRQNGWEVFFLSKFYLGGELIRQKGFSVEVFEKEESKEASDGFYFGKTEELKADMEWISSVLSKQKTDVICLDSYNVNPWFLKELKKHTPCLVYLDDLAAWDYPVDIILNPNVDAKEKGYAQFQNQQKHLLGATYCLLRGEFSNLPKRGAKEDIKDILITTGAADPWNMTEVCLELCQQICPEAVYHLIIGNAFQQQEEWVKKALGQIRIYQSPKAMSKIMLQCDVAVSAGGSTLYELAACGVPTLAFLYSENQRGVVEYFDQRELLVNLGEFQNIRDKEKQAVEHFSIGWNEIRSQKRRQDIIEKQQSLFDGKGRNRVVKEIEEFFKR